VISALLLGWTGLGNLARPDGARHPSGEADHAGQHHYAQEDQVDDSWDGFPMELVWVAGERDGLQHGKQEVAKDVHATVTMRARSWCYSPAEAHR